MIALLALLLGLLALPPTAHGAGELDPAFDGDGRVVTDFGAYDRAIDVAIQADGKIVAAGFSGAGANPFNFVLARYLAGPVNLPPDCSTVSANPNALWPPNHRLGLVP